MRLSFSRALFFAAVFSGGAVAVSAQNAPANTMPPNYRGVQVHVDGIYVMPVPNAPFTADVEIVSHNIMPDGTDHVVTTTNHIGRSSSGRIYNERRQLVPPGFRGEPRLLSAHTYDPGTRMNIYTDTRMHLARESVSRRPAVTPAEALPPSQQRLRPGYTESDLGMQSVDDVPLHGIRKTRTIPAEASGTGKAIVITDDYWYSEALSIYMIIRHNDPRTGEQLVAVTKVERTEPPAEMFVIPPSYKVVDETPPDMPETQNWQ